MCKNMLCFISRIRMDLRLSQDMPPPPGGRSTTLPAKLQLGTFFKEDWLLKMNESCVIVKEVTALVDLEHKPASGLIPLMDFTTVMS
jgi:hypothetical protein